MLRVVIIGAMNDEEWPTFLTVQETATIMRVSKMTVYRLIKSGTLGSKRIGRSFRVKSESLKQYLADADVELEIHEA